MPVPVQPALPGLTTVPVQPGLTTVPVPAQSRMQEAAWRAASSVSLGDVSGLSESAQGY